MGRSEKKVVLSMKNCFRVFFYRVAERNLSPHHSLIRQVWLLSPSTDEETTTAAAAAKSLQLCPTLRNPIDGSPLGSPVPGILQARTLEWVAISFSNA